MDVKLQLTRHFAEELGLQTSQEYLDTLLWKWWKNPRSTGTRSFALTEEGFEALSKEAKLKFYQIDLPEGQSYTNQSIIWLDKFVDCPYYFTKKSIFVSREKVAVQLILFGGDINKFGNAKEKSRQAR